MHSVWAASWSKVRGGEFVKCVQLFHIWINTVCLSQDNTGVWAGLILRHGYIPEKYHTFPFKTLLFPRV